MLNDVIREIIRVDNNSTFVRFSSIDKDSFKSVIAKRIQELDIDDSNESYAIRLDDQLTLYFTQTHLAEIQEILSLLDQYGTPESPKKSQ